MTLTEAQGILKASQRLSQEDQHAQRAKIIEAFRTLWTHRPTEAEFAAHTARLVLTPEMLYIMARE